MILGGYDMFGSRIATLLSDADGLEIYVCGRDGRKAEAFCATYRGKPRTHAVTLDRIDVAYALSTIRPDLLVDASGPFQGYGAADPYQVPRACIAAGVDYADLADGAAFVAGIGALDPAAKAAGTFAISGLSTCPALTSAVLDRIAETMEIETVEGGIAPSPFANLGLSVMRAVVGYAGSPVTLLRDGAVATGTGLAETRRYVVAPPGRMPLRERMFSLVDVPDLRVLPVAHPSLRDAWFGAGPVPEALHAMLVAMARMRARLALPSLGPLSRPFHFAKRLLQFGEHRGGMYVRATGTRDGRPSETSWHLIAEGDDGPLIPSMAVASIVTSTLAGRKPTPGARTGAGAMTLDDYEQMFVGRRITHGFRKQDDETEGPLFQRLLGDAYERLPIRLREMHDGAHERKWTGTASVDVGATRLARAIAGIVGFPRATGERTVEVRIDASPHGETWRRRFGTEGFSSEMTAGTGPERRLLVERFGPIAVALALVLDGGKLRLVPRRWRLWGVRMPNAMLPWGDCHEGQDGDAFRFHVEVVAPIAGLLVRYVGTLRPTGRTDANANADAAEGTT